MALKNEDREPDHRESDERSRDRGRCEEQRVETFRRDPAQHGILAWLIRGAPKSPYSPPFVSEPGHTPSRPLRIEPGRGCRGKLSTGADSTSPLGLPGRILPTLGWGEAALDVRFVSAHQGRRLAGSLCARPVTGALIRPDAAKYERIQDLAGNQLRGVNRPSRGRPIFECCLNITSDPNSPRRGTTRAARVYVSRGPLD